MNCIACDHALTEVMDLGRMALAGRFLKREDFAAEKTYRLRLGFCEQCYALQVMDHVTDAELFDHYFYFSSNTGTGRKHFEDYARRLNEKLEPEVAIEIGCNDGVMLRPLADIGIRCIGVDPSRAVESLRTTGIPFLREYWTPEVAKAIGAGVADLVVANNVMAHVTNPREFVEAVAIAMRDDGTFVFELHSLSAMVEKMQYDWIYHEHRLYWSLMALEKLLATHGLRVYDLEHVEMHGGSIRYYACKDGRPTLRNVTIQRTMEREMGLRDAETFRNFAWAVEDHAKALRVALGEYRKQGMVIAGYGASGRGNALISHAKLSDLLHCMFDDSAQRQGVYTPGHHLHVNPGEALKEMEIPDMLLLTAWTYAEEVAQKLYHFRGPLIVPLPTMQYRRTFVADGSRTFI